MKLLAQFYACLAFVLFVAMIASMAEAYSSSQTMTAGIRRGLAAEPPPAKSPPHDRARREAGEPPKAPEKHAEHNHPTGPPRQRREVTPMEQEAEHEPPKGPPRARRQAPEGIPNPQDMMNKMPMPPGRK